QINCNSALTSISRTTSSSRCSAAFRRASRKAGGSSLCSCRVHSHASSVSVDSPVRLPYKVDDGELVEGEGGGGRLAEFVEALPHHGFAHVHHAHHIRHRAVEVVRPAGMALP